MKRLFAVLMILFVLVLTCGCSKTNVNKNSDVTLTFIYGEENISVTLENDEAEKVIDILNENNYDPIFSVFLPVVLIKTFPSQLVVEPSQLLVTPAIAYKISVI